MPEQSLRSFPLLCSLALALTQLPVNVTEIKMVSLGNQPHRLGFCQVIPTHELTAAFLQVPVNLSQINNQQLNLISTIQFTLLNLSF